MGNFVNGPHLRQSCWISSCHQQNFANFSDFYGGGTETERLRSWFKSFLKLSWVS